MTVQIIKATKQIQGLAPGVIRNAGRLRVAAYCRVSTDSDGQATSYEAQCRHYTDFITANPEWELAGIYADEGISGTSTKRRGQFNRMLADCEKGLIDMVITKSISRWARNTIDSLKSIRRLKDLGIPVWFEKENINTMDAKGEVLITIMSSLAQQESESISKNVRMGIQYIFRQGRGRLSTAQFLGLGKGDDGRTLVIIPEEAAVVRRIFREYLEGYSPGMIASHLTADGILTPAGGQTWYQSTIDSILKNEKYCGDLLMQKYFVADVLSHKVVKNEGQLPQYFVENAHEPIIPKEVFRQVQGELRRRAMLKYDPSKLRFGSALALSGRKLKRYTNPDPARIDWRCRSRAYDKRSVTKEVKPKCGCRNANEKEIEAAVAAAFNELPGMRDKLVRMQGALWDGDLKRLDTMIENNKEQQGRFAGRLAGLAAADETPERSEEIDFLRAEMERLKTEQETLMLERAEAAHREVQIRLLLELADAMKKKCDESHGISVDGPEKDSGGGACYGYEEFFRRTRYIPEDGVLDGEGRISGFFNDLVIRYLDTVTVASDGYGVAFKAGLTVKVEAGVRGFIKKILAILPGTGYTE